MTLKYKAPNQLIAHYSPSYVRGIVTQLYGPLKSLFEVSHGRLHVSQNCDLYQCKNFFETDSDQQQYYLARPFPQVT